MNHDQHFKNLILDYQCEALCFFAAEEAGGIDQATRHFAASARATLRALGL